MTGHIPHLIIGNPENRRVAGFVAALSELGHPPPVVLAHADLIEDPRALERLDDRPYRVRIDATGENETVAQGLLRLGLSRARELGVSTIAPPEIDQLEPAQVAAPRQHHLGFEVYLGRLQQVFEQRPAWHVLSPVPEIIALFDKRVCSARYRALGIPIPEALAATTVDELRAGMEARRWNRVFVKLSCGSSASGLAVFSRSDQRELVMTTLSMRDGKMFNSLRVQRLERRELIEQALGFLLGEGAHVERAVPKARLDGAFMDCRILCIAGEPLFTVVRQSRHPITNLHLGGRRGNVRAFERAVAPPVLAAARHSCRKVAAAHGCHQLGIDVLFTPGFRDHRVIEANAFGDLLPGLERDGLSVYATQIRAVESG